MKEKMSRWGIGPVFALFSIIYGVTALVISRYFYPVFLIPFVPAWLLSALGIALIIIGVPFFIISVITVTRAYESDVLVTDGIYRYCRHPLYSAWVFFFVPGIVLLVNSWIGLTTPLFMYFLLYKLVKKEEAYLEHVFGSEYIEYKNKVPCILPADHLIQIVRRINSVRSAVDS